MPRARRRLPRPRPLRPRASSRLRRPNSRPILARVIRLRHVRRVGRRAANAAADGLLTELGLEPVAGREVGALGHGERQWVEIGMVVAQQPKLILLDEPTAGMGADEVERTADLLRAVNAKSSLIVVEHDMQFIRMIGGIVTVLHQGRILIEDTMQNVLDSQVVREVYLGSGQARG